MKSLVVAAVISSLLLSACWKTNSRSAQLTELTQFVNKTSGNQRKCSHVLNENGGIHSENGEELTNVGRFWCRYINRNLDSQWIEGKSASSDVINFSSKGVHIIYYAPNIEGIRNIDSKNCSKLKRGGWSDLFNKSGPLKVCEKGSLLDNYIEYNVRFGKYGPIPYIFIRPIGGNIRTSITYVQGGPYVNELFNINKLQLISYLMKQPGNQIIIPQYMGTFPVSVHDRDDIDVAARQISEFERFSFLKLGHKSGCIIGGSLGAEVVSRAKLQYSDKILLISPLMESAQSAIRRWLASGRFEDGKRRLLDVPMSAWTSGHLIEGSNTLSNKSTAFLRYFGRHASENPNVGRLFNSSAIKPNISVIYGASDIKIGVDRVENYIGGNPHVSVKRLMGAGHEFEDASNFWAFEQSVHQFVERCAEGIPVN